MSKTRVLRLVVLVAGAGFACWTPALAHHGQPADMVAIHYNRCDGSYDGWGVHLWKDPGTPLPDVSWQKPMMPAGKTEFGPYWNVKADEFGPKVKVNYIIHKGDSKDQGGRDMSFDGMAVREIYVNSGDRKIYTSLEDANKARAENPCK